MERYVYTAYDRNTMVSSKNASTLNEAFDLVNDWKVVYQFFMMAVLESRTNPHYVIGVKWRVLEETA